MPNKLQPANPAAYTNLRGIKRKVIAAGKSRGMNLGTFIRYAVEEQLKRDGYTKGVAR